MAVRFQLSHMLQLSLPHRYYSCSLIIIHSSVVARCHVLPVQSREGATVHLSLSNTVSGGHVGRKEGEEANKREKSRREEIIFFIPRLLPLLQQTGRYPSYFLLLLHVFSPPSSPVSSIHLWLLQPLFPCIPSPFVPSLSFPQHPLIYTSYPLFLQYLSYLPSYFPTTFPVPSPAGVSQLA